MGTPPTATRQAGAPHSGLLFRGLHLHEGLPELAMLSAGFSGRQGSDTSERPLPALRLRCDLSQSQHERCLLSEGELAAEILLALQVCWHRITGVHAEGDGKACNIQSPCLWCRASRQPSCICRVGACEQPRCKGPAWPASCSPSSSLVFYLLERCTTWPSFKCCKQFADACAGAQASSEQPWTRMWRRCRTSAPLAQHMTRACR